MRYEKTKNKIRKLYISKDKKTTNLEELNNIPSPYNKISVNLNKIHEYETEWATFPTNPDDWYVHFYDPIFANSKDCTAIAENCKAYIDFDNLPESMIPFVNITLLLKTTNNSEKIVPTLVYKDKKVLDYYLGCWWGDIPYKLRGNGGAYFKIYGDDVLLYEGIGFERDFEFYDPNDLEIKHPPISIDDIIENSGVETYWSTDSKYPSNSPHTKIYWGKYQGVTGGGITAFYWTSGLNHRLGHCYYQSGSLNTNLPNSSNWGLVQPPYEIIKLEMNDPYPLWFEIDAGMYNWGDVEWVVGERFWIKRGENKYRLYIKTDVCIEGNGQPDIEEITYTKINRYWKPYYKYWDDVEEEYYWTFTWQGTENLNYWYYYEYNDVVEENLGFSVYVIPKNPIEMKVLINFKNLRKYHEIRGFKKKD